MCVWAQYTVAWGAGNDCSRVQLSRTRQTRALALTNAPPPTHTHTRTPHRYATTDLAALKYRVQDQGADWVIYVVDNGQSSHLEQVFEASRQVRSPSSLCCYFLFCFYGVCGCCYCCGLGSVAGSGRKEVVMILPPPLPLSLN